MSTVQTGGTPWGLPHTLLGPGKSPADRLHGRIDLTRLETLLLDWPALARLQYVHQNTAADAAYTTATGMRKSHVLGTVQAAQQILDALAQPAWPNGITTLFDEWRRDGVFDVMWAKLRVLVRLVALLHDLGHTPFSHHVEDVYRLFPAHDAGWERFLRVWSTLPQYLDSLVSDGELSREERALLQTLVDGELYEQLWPGIIAKRRANVDQQFPFAKDLINVFPGADQWDYVPRDMRAAGLPYATDNRWLQAVTVTGAEHPSFPRRVALHVTRKGFDREEIITAIESLARARLDAFRVLYGEHAVLAKAGMAAKAIELWIAHEAEKRGGAEAGREAVERELLRRGDSGILEHLACLYEAEVDLCGSEAARTRLLATSSLARDAYYRRLFKRGLVSADRRTAYRLRREFGDSEARPELERLVADDAGVNADELVLRIPPPGMKEKNLQRLLFIDQGEVVLATKSRWAGKLKAVAAEQRASWTARLFVHRGIAADGAALERLRVALENHTRAHWSRELH